MLVDGKPYRTVWMGDDGVSVEIIDQRKLPFAFELVTLRSTEDAARAIREMYVRGAGCIGAFAAHGMYLAALECTEAPDFDELFSRKGEELKATRPTAVNLAWAVDRQVKAVGGVSGADQKIALAKQTALEVANEDAAWCRAIGEHGLTLIKAIAEKKAPGEPVNILTHCNAGWLAFVDFGSATAPVYAAHDAGIPVHVWVDETRPRNQGARLTAWELGQHGVPHTVIPDNVGGHLMQHGKVDLVITGTDRTTFTGDVANKIGTYLKALAAHDNGVPFYVALPSSTFDWEIRDGVAGIPIEERSGDEVSIISGVPTGAGAENTAKDGCEIEVNLVAKGSPVANYSFDVTPARLVTGLITERGICDASESSVLSLFPEKRLS
ncbi:S-methyl-5-thioribose-1-phosphate isomerase [Verrucomicrobiales bacterium BCK34]|nr:S-methyl-5-thioribose-1-phosphate isomerase [Verrucomicrobiales bacterium BCK34]